VGRRSGVRVHAKSPATTSQARFARAPSPAGRSRYARGQLLPVIPRNRRLGGDRLGVTMQEECGHHRYAVRDLVLLPASQSPVTSAPGTGKSP
jgi:hypothetical protein